jgi:hypothetical protein
MSVLVCPLYQVSPQFLAVTKGIQQRLGDLGHYSEPVKDVLNAVHPDVLFDPQGIRIIQSNTSFLL